MAHGTASRHPAQPFGSGAARHPAARQVRPRRAAANTVTSSQPRSAHDAKTLSATTVGAALASLTDLRNPPTALLDGRIDTALREALTFQPPTPRDRKSATALGAAAARSACAHLAAHAWTDADLGLLTAQDHLGTPRPRDLP